MASLRKEITSCLSSLENASQRGLFSDSEGDRFQHRIKKITSRLKALPDAPDTADALQDFPPAQRQIIKEIIETIYMTEEHSESADRLVGKILSRLRSKRKRRWPCGVYVLECLIVAFCWSSLPVLLYGYASFRTQRKRGCVATRRWVTVSMAPKYGVRFERLNS